MAAIIRNVFSFAARRTQRFHLSPNICSVGKRGFKRSQRPVLIELYKRRIEQGPEPERHRSAWLNWNYDAEVFAFGKRLGEDFSSDTLQVAFTHRSYIEREETQRQELGLDQESVSLGLQDNEELAESGEAITRSYLKAYLRHSLPSFPEEGVIAVCEYLMTEEMMVYIASNLGVGELILTDEFPPSPPTICKTFKAVIGALAKDSGGERAHLLVQDLVLTQLIGKDLDHIWEVVNPMGELVKILQKQGRGEPEPRLLFETGSETILAAYIVGIYSDRQLIGKSAGETVSIAEELAARDALKTIFRIPWNKSPFKFGKQGHELNIDLNKVNPSLATLASQTQLHG